MVKGMSFFRMMREYRNRPEDTTPANALPSVRTDLGALPDEGLWLVWFGHSSYLLKWEGLTILVDPVFSGHAAPVSFMAKAFPGSDVYGVAEMPPVDILLITHDHYDHLDYRTVMALQPKVGRYITSLGVGAHLEYWGVSPDKIVELDWWEGVTVPGGGPEREALTFTAAPARHFSGRGFRRGGTLWSSFAVNGSGHSVYLGGDSGYERHFLEIGDRFGPVDLAILECGQYGKNWPLIHMKPEETVRAAAELRAAALLPVHWGKFTLSLHPWNEPVKRVLAAAKEFALPVMTPMIGEVVRVGAEFHSAVWW